MKKKKVNSALKGLCLSWPSIHVQATIIVSFWLVEMAISTNQIYRNLYENTGPDWYIMFYTVDVMNEFAQFLYSAP